MSLSNKNSTQLVALARQLVQPLLGRFHKGQAGKIAVIGGCEDYTGAPFFAAHSAASVGADLSHVVCARGAATVIKSYSPDLMIHPYLHDSDSAPADITAEAKKISWDKLGHGNTAVDSYVDKAVMPRVLALLERVDVVVVGPGFGRDPLMLRTLVRILEQIKVMNKPVVVDADALFVVANYPQIINNYLNAVLTPNVVEYGRLEKAVEDLQKGAGEGKKGDAKTQKEPSADKSQPLDAGLAEATASEHPHHAEDDPAAGARALSKALGGVTIVRKGALEVIANADVCVACTAEGLPRRVGGQGDTLAGAIATFVTWEQNYHRKLWDNSVLLSAQESRVLACFAAATVVRTASLLAFCEKKRAMQTSDVHRHLGAAYEAVVEK